MLIALLEWVGTVVGRQPGSAEASCRITSLSTGNLSRAPSAARYYTTYLLSAPLYHPPVNPSAIGGLGVLRVLTYKAPVPSSPPSRVNLQDIKPPPSAPPRPQSSPMSFRAATTRIASRRSAFAAPNHQHLFALRQFHTTSPNMVVHNIATKAAFDEALKTHSVVIVDAFATWCGPCKAIAPLVAK
ncbi:hypothetical protein NUW58_g8789 [Xylaria curta]|uniref:Uncharacterized protein n=1 Tax=Xylaria curta TaxID=42375 RepID=A0ACC1N478_9PEZI|nr:hypothetical protein NUW58_g8789 [Xylaria curta]